MKLIAILSLTLLAGCAGIHKSEPVLNPDGTAKTRFFGLFPVKKVERKTETVAMIEAIAPAAANIKNVAPEPCDKASIGDIAKLPEQVAIKYYEAVEECHRSRSDSYQMAYVMGRPTSSLEAVANATTQAIKYVQDGKSARVSAVGSNLLNAVTYGVGGLVLDSAFKANRDVGIEAARNGNTTIGDVTVSQTQSVSNSNDPSSGMGSADSNATSTNTGGDINLSLGRGNRSFVTNDESRLNSTDGNIQALEPSANGAQNNDSRTSGQITSDDFTGDTNNSDDDSALGQ